jgi:hypothetical protein
MEVANTLAYYDTATITAVRNFTVQAPGVNVIKLFIFVTDVEAKKAKAFVPGKPFQPCLTYGDSSV